LNATLGMEFTPLSATQLGQVALGFPFIQPTTDRLHEGETQVWQVVHNGVDTHAIHFHLMNVQVLGRIDWAGVPKLPDANERGWREIVRMHPLETTVIAVRMNRPGQNLDKPANNPPIPFADSIPVNLRISDPTSAMAEVNPPIGRGGLQVQAPFVGFANLPINYANAIEDFSWEYVWHCHLLGHEEADMMRPLVMQLDTVNSRRPRIDPPLGAAVAIQ